jgi:hypothetical protein
VPVDGFWSISVYNAKGYFEKNDLDAYSLSNLTEKLNPDGSLTVQFGACTKDTVKCLPITPGWNYTVRLLPAAEGNSGWRLVVPKAQPLRWKPAI